MSDIHDTETKKNTKKNAKTLDWRSDKMQALYGPRPIAVAPDAWNAQRVPLCSLLPRGLDCLPRDAVLRREANDPAVVGIAVLGTESESEPMPRPGHAHLPTRASLVFGMGAGRRD